MPATRSDPGPALRPVLMYHDVVPAGRYDLSGFQGQHADHYKLTTAEFEGHLDAVLAAAGEPATVETRPASDEGTRHQPWAITFDDGGLSAWTEIAPRLEARGCRGYFFITTDRIGEPGFLTVEQLRDLAARGHVIGSHTCSHPPRISTLDASRLDHEWRRSRERLERILDQPVTTASIPGGYYSRLVAETAVACGLTTVFTSEPRHRPWPIGAGVALGRYAVTRLTNAAEAARLACGDPRACSRQWLAWNARKSVKKLAGPLYEPVRRLLLKAR
jgi:peptidoglycan/xylan/chitin deacetylase (PgdA/CDA1 family)